MVTEVDGKKYSFSETEKQCGWEMDMGEGGTGRDWGKKRKEKIESLWRVL